MTHRDLGIPASSERNSTRLNGVSDSTKDYARALYDHAISKQEARDIRLSHLPRTFRITAWQLWFLLASTAGLAGAAGYGLRGGGSTQIAAIPAPTVMIDLRTGKTFQAAEDAEADTESTLPNDPSTAIAVWCPKCQNWHPAPTPEQIKKMPQGRPVCPKHPDTPLTAGP